MGRRRIRVLTEEHERHTDTASPAVGSPPRQAAVAVTLGILSGSSGGFHPNVLEVGFTEKGFILGYMGIFTKKVKGTDLCAGVGM